MYSKGGGYPEKFMEITTWDMGFSYELFYLNTETESLGEVQGFGMHECRAMGRTIQWRKGGVRRRECKRYTLRSFSLLFQSSSSSLPQKCCFLRKRVCSMTRLQSCRVNPRLFLTMTWIKHNLFRESRREFQTTLRWNYYHWPVPNPHPRRCAQRESPLQVWHLWESSLQVLHLRKKVHLWESPLQVLQETQCSTWRGDSGMGWQQLIGSNKIGLFCRI